MIDRFDYWFFLLVWIWGVYLHEATILDIC